AGGKGEMPKSTIFSTPLVDIAKANTSSSLPMSPLARRIAEASNLDLGAVQGTGPGKRIMRRDVESTLSASQMSTSKPRATPAARRLAREAGLDLSAMSGTGPRRRIQAENVIEAIKASAYLAPLSPALSPTQAEGKGEKLGLTNLGVPTREPGDSPRIVKL